MRKQSGRRFNETERDYEIRLRNERAYEEWPVGCLVTVEGAIENKILYTVVRHRSRNGFAIDGQQSICWVCFRMPEYYWIPIRGNVSTILTARLRRPNPLLVLALMATPGTDSDVEWPAKI